MNIEMGGHLEQTSRWNEMEIANNSKSNTQTENRKKRCDYTTRKHRSEEFARDNLGTNSEIFRLKQTPTEANRSETAIAVVIAQL